MELEKSPHEAGFAGWASPGIVVSKDRQAYFHSEGSDEDALLFRKVKLALFNSEHFAIAFRQPWSFAFIDPEEQTNVEMGPSEIITWSVKGREHVNLELDYTSFNAVFENIKSVNYRRVEVNNPHVFIYRGMDANPFLLIHNWLIVGSKVVVKDDGDMDKVTWTQEESEVTVDYPEGMKGTLDMDVYEGRLIASFWQSSEKSDESAKSL